MPIGSVSVDDNGNVSGSGTCLDLYNAIAAVETAFKPLIDPNTPDADWDDTPQAWKDQMLPVVVNIKRAWAREATAHATVFDSAFTLPVPPAGVARDGANVNTDETQAAAAPYGDLATVGPTVTLTTGTSALVFFSAVVYRAGAAGNTCFIAPAVTGASAIAASDANSSFGAATVAGNGYCLSRALYLTGLTAGSNTFRLKYRNDGGTTWHFMNRSLAVIAL